MLTSEALCALQALILSCKKAELDYLIKSTDLPRKGTKRDVQLRLISYLAQDPSPAFLSALRQLNSSHCGESNQGDHIRHYVSVLANSDTSSSWEQPSSDAITCSAPTTPMPPLASNTSTSRHDAPSSHSAINSTVVNHGPFISLAAAEGCFRLPSTLPELCFRDSPFFKPLDVILQPHVMTPSLIPFATGRRSYDRSFVLRFNSDQAETITYHCSRKSEDRMDFGVQVVMRFAQLNPGFCELLSSSYKNSTFSSSAAFLQPLEDSFPVHLSIIINGNPVQLPPLLPSNRPGKDGRRNPRPVNVTQFLRVSPAMPNHIKITWTHDYTLFAYHLVAVYLMRKRSPQELCKMLQSNAMRSSQAVKLEIIEKLKPSATEKGSTAQDDDDLIICNTLPAQLLCPLSKCRIEVPIRGINCHHIQCYDATTYLIINERKPSWNCPVCDKQARFEDLFVDGMFLEVLNSERSKSHDAVIFSDDGTWSVSGNETSFGCVDNREDDGINFLPHNPSDPLVKKPSLDSDSHSCSTSVVSFGVSPSDSTSSSITSPHVSDHLVQKTPNFPESAPQFSYGVNSLTSSACHVPVSTSSESQSVTIDLTISDDEDAVSPKQQQMPAIPNCACPTQMNMVPPKQSDALLQYRGVTQRYRENSPCHSMINGISDPPWSSSCTSRKRSAPPDTESASTVNRSESPVASKRFRDTPGFVYPPSACDPQFVRPPSYIPRYSSRYKSHERPHCFTSSRHPYRHPLSGNMPHQFAPPYVNVPSSVHPNFCPYSPPCPECWNQNLVDRMMPSGPRSGSFMDFTFPSRFRNAPRGYHP